jgi:hypothetical protein
MNVFYGYLDLDAKQREKIRLDICEYAGKGNFAEIEKLILSGNASVCFSYSFDYL